MAFEVAHNHVAEGQHPEPAFGRVLDGVLAEVAYKVVGGGGAAAVTHHKDLPILPVGLGNQIHSLLELLRVDGVHRPVQLPPVLV